VIVNSGSLKLLNAQRTYLATLDWALFTSDTFVEASTVWANLTEAAWGGYFRAPAGVWRVPIVLAGRAVVYPVALPGFSNSSGAPQNYFGWALVDSAGPTLIAAKNLGQQTIPDGGAFNLSPQISDRQE
jgi:hypothetical protein